MTMSVWDYILDNTNQYARNRLASVPLRRRSTFRNWKDITMVEMKAFIGVVIQMGLVHLSDIKEGGRSVAARAPERETKFPYLRHSRIGLNSIPLLYIRKSA